MPIIRSSRVLYSSCCVWYFGSKFPPTVSKDCQHQHSAILKTKQQYEIPTIPVLLISKVLLPQSNIMAAFFHSHSNHSSDVSPGLPTYSNKISYNFQYIQYGHLQLTCADSFSRGPTVNIQQSLSHIMYSIIHYVHLLLKPSDSCRKCSTVNIKL